MNKASIVKQIFLFAMNRKKYWLIPLLIVFVILSLVVVLGEGSVVAPLIYSLF